MTTARLTSCVWIPDLGLPPWCSQEKWLAHVERDETPMRGAQHAAKDRDEAIDIAFKMSASWGPQEEIRDPREQGRLF